MISTLTKIDDEVIAEIQAEMAIRRTTEVFLLFAMGSQFDHLIYQALSRLGVYCLVADPASVIAADVTKLAPIGIIVSGGPASVHSEPPPFDNAIFEIGIPVLGICLGFQMWAKHVGAKVAPGKTKEFGVHQVINAPGQGLFVGCGKKMPVLQSHGDEVTECPPAVHILARVSGSKIIAGARYQHLWGVQFHPECTETIHGERMFENFCFDICQAQDRFPAGEVADQKIEDLMNKIGSDSRIILALSGGSDSSVVAHLLRLAIESQPERVRAVYIKGIDRPDDEAFVRKYFGNQSWLELVVVNATDEFVRVLAGKIKGHDKRVAMRSVYKEVLEKHVSDFGANFIAQGTLYTDVCESGGGHATGARKAKIKLHHNTNLGFSVPELTPLDDCVKDGARDIGRSIGVPEELLIRHPFPGPGLVVRIEGEVTAEKLVMARQLDDIYIEELRRAGLYKKVWQAGVEVTSSVHTCTKGDDAGVGAVVVYWAVSSVNGFTAQAYDLPWEFRCKVKRRFANEVPGVGYTAHGDGDKPPSTIEWE